MKYYCYGCQKATPDLATAIYSRGHWWCRKHATLIVVDGVERVDFPSEGKLISESIMEASDY